MSETLAFPLYLLFMVLQVFFIVLTVFRRWHQKEKKEEDEKSDGFFSYFDGDLAFMTSMWNKPGVCFHLSQLTFQFEQYPNSLNLV